MSMKRLRLAFLAMIALILFGCTKETIRDNKEQNDDVNLMSLIASYACVSAGDKAVITVQTKNNPGFLCMELLVNYDVDIMNLVKVENGRDFLEYNFMPAKKLTDGCKMVWFVAENQYNTANGELLKLYFDISNNVHKGNYIVSVVPIDDGGIVDGNARPIVVSGTEAIITIK